MAGPESNTAEYFENDTWTLAKSYKTVLYDACLTFIPNHNDRVYIIGGNNGEIISRDIEYYDFAADDYFGLTSIPGIPNIQKLGCTGYIGNDQLRSLVMIGGFIADIVSLILYGKIGKMITQPSRLKQIPLGRIT